MTNWIIPADYKTFLLDACIDELGFIEWRSRNSYEIGDIVYLYCSTPIRRITHKMQVVRINIPAKEAYDDSRFQTKQNNRTYPEDAVYVRLQFIERTPANKLTLSQLREQGVTSCMQGAMRINGDLLKYVESAFTK